MCVCFWVVVLNTLYVWICRMLMYNDVYVYILCIDFTIKR